MVNSRPGHIPKVAPVGSSLGQQDLSGPNSTPTTYQIMPTFFISSPKNTTLLTFQMVLILNNKYFCHGPVIVEFYL